MTKCRFGTDLTGERNRGYEYLLYTEFPDTTRSGTTTTIPCTGASATGSRSATASPLAFDYYLDDQHRSDGRA